MEGEVDRTGGLDKGGEFLGTAGGKCCLEGVSVRIGKVWIILISVK